MVEYSRMLEEQGGKPHPSMWLVKKLASLTRPSGCSSCAWQQAALRTLVITPNNSNEARVCSVASCRITRKLLRRVLTTKGSEMQWSSASSSAEHYGEDNLRPDVIELCHILSQQDTWFKLMTPWFIEVKGLLSCTDN